MTTDAATAPGIADDPLAVAADEPSPADSDIQLPDVERSDARSDDWLQLLDEQGRLPPCPIPWRHPLRAAGWVIRLLFGLASLIVMLAVIAAIPVVNFLALGYLLEVEGRLGRDGRWRDAFPLLNLAPRFGSIALGVWLWLIPVRLIAGAAADARLIDPGAFADRALHLLTGVVWLLTIVHLCLALARGGSPGCFLRPLRNFRWLKTRLTAGDYLETASSNLREFVSRLRLRHHFWLGLRGFAVALLWLIGPTALFAAADGTEGPQVLLTLAGGALLALVLAWVPFLQARFATENRFRSGLQLGAVRRLFPHAPLAWLLATVVVYVLALPLYLFKAFLLPPDAMWPITLIFIVSIYPARVVTGWAYHRAVTRQQQGRTSGRAVRWGVRLALVPLLGAYVFLLYFTQFIGEHGRGVLFEHHAFLLPVPF